DLAIFLAAAISVLGFGGCESSTAPPSPTKYSLTLRAIPSNTGSITRSPDLAQFTAGTTVTLTAVPAAGYVFDHWEGDAAGAANPTTVTMNADKAVTAVFGPVPQYALAVASSPSDGGDVSRSHDQAQYTAGTAVTLTAAPAVGYTFDRWEGDAAGTGNPTTVTMNADKAVTAVFSPIPQYTLAVSSSPSEGGNVSRSPDQAQYASGTVVTLAAAPAEGYAFDHWEGAASGTDNPATVTMDADKAVTAVFAVPPYGTSETERRALIALYNATDGDAWTDHSGWKTPPLDADGFALPGTESAWFGVTVDPGTKKVTRVSLGGNNLNGAIPSAIGDLAGLQSLQLSGNLIAGPIPPEIGNMTQLAYLFLFRNRLSGPIPPELGRLPHLRQIHIYSNQLSGPIPVGLTDSTSLQWIVLRDNQLSGEIPPELGRMTDLRVLRLGDNLLAGTIPPELGNLVNLQSLRLRNNRLGGEVPGSLGNLTQLWELLLDANHLTGTVPSSFVNLAGLTATNIGYNGLHASDEALLAFLAAKDPDWAEAQTIAPEQVAATPLDGGVILVSWLPVSYTADPGHYKVLISEAAGGPYTAAGQTADKAASSLQVAGLMPGTLYDFVVQTHTDPNADNVNAVDSDYSAEASAVAWPQAPEGPAARSGGWSEAATCSSTWEQLIGPRIQKSTGPLQEDSFPRTRRPTSLILPQVPGLCSAIVR
ncbi:MAG TPA: InlB B-repeat-containing protein, partial [Acidobacteriota bacterium]|nr:InlB B-repeat-containing protein [Acidobacteriota bacterium]